MCSISRNRNHTSKPGAVFLSSLPLNISENFSLLVVQHKFVFKNIYIWSFVKVINKLFKVNIAIKVGAR